jgi:hypothetical protein
MLDPSRPGVVCVFCFVHRDREQPETCTYGMRHEYGEDSVPKISKQEPKRSKNLCLKCGLHPKNPKAIGCEHVFED